MDNFKRNDNDWLIIKSSIDNLLKDGFISSFMRDLMLKNARKKMGYLVCEKQLNQDTNKLAISKV